LDVADAPNQLPKYDDCGVMVVDAARLLNSGCANACAIIFVTNFIDTNMIKLYETLL
jgi:hypothetical protein